VLRRLTPVLLVVVTAVVVATLLALVNPVRQPPCVGWSAAYGAAVASHKLGVLVPLCNALLAP